MFEKVVEFKKIRENSMEWHRLRNQWEKGCKITQAYCLYDEYENQLPIFLSEAEIDEFQTQR